MMKNSLLFSFLVSILSLIIVFVAPIEISIRDTGKVYSPYREELDALRLKTEKGLHPSAPEWKRFDELLEKNNQWFEEHHKEYLRNTATSAREAWKKKSDYVSPVIMLLWGILFYFFFRHQMESKALFVLTFPIILLITQLMSILEVVLISFAVLIVYFWFVLNKKNVEQQ